jgi:hypothetical protein
MKIKLKENGEYIGITFPILKNYNNPSLTNPVDTTAVRFAGGFLASLGYMAVSVILGKEDVERVVAGGAASGRQFAGLMKSVGIPALRGCAGGGLVMVLGGVVEDFVSAYS